MAHPQLQSSDSFDGDEKPEEKVSQAAGLQWQFAKPTAPVSATPVTNTPNLQDTGTSIPPSLVDQDVPSSFSQERGTPLAVGAFSVQKSYTTPFRSQKPSKLSASFTLSSPLVSSKRGEYAEAIGNVTSDSEEESEREEARLLLSVARAQHCLRQLEQDVVHAQLAENTALNELYQFRASQAQKNLDATEYDLGCLRNTIRKNGISLADVPSARKRRRMSNETSLSAASGTPDI
ncbi:hypothetical protein JVT61DRAFT_7069 [Boletus reticuloceps]|uniref:Uncharacterized protein n=1 Tax=Boletus reticuloceps TaxID=495285 RepID=A0A8I2YJ67_9AGAM|nr:hypothetical protein JVT61DRAFT_7069 [Boletus reticuloceps]